jgi:hypothetical protein
MKNLTQIMEERIKKHWDMEIVRGYLTSNVPTEIVEDRLFSFLSVDSDEEFIEMSKQEGILKNSKYFFN